MTDAPPRRPDVMRKQFEAGWRACKAESLKAARSVTPISRHGSYRFREQQVIAAVVTAIDEITPPKKTRARENR